MYAETDNADSDSHFFPTRSCARLSHTWHGCDLVYGVATRHSRVTAGPWLYRTGHPDGSISSRWFGGTDRASLHEFLPGDINLLLISVSLTDNTRHILDNDKFSLLGKMAASVVNISRGPTVV